MCLKFDLLWLLHFVCKRSGVSIFSKIRETVYNTGTHNIQHVHEQGITNRTYFLIHIKDLKTYVKTIQLNSGIQITVETVTEKLTNDCQTTGLRKYIAKLCDQY